MFKGRIDVWHCFSYLWATQKSQKEESRGKKKEKGRYNNNACVWLKEKNDQ